MTVRSRSHAGMKGFTLIELLVVVSIIALLISILLPSLREARSQAKRVKCGANLHSIGQAIASCSTENNGYGPTWDDGGVRSGRRWVMLTWIDVLFDTGYLGEERVGLCPADQRPDGPPESRGRAWDIYFKDKFRVDEALKPGVRHSYAINAQMHWNHPRDKYADSARQVYAMEGWWTWFGSVNAYWLMLEKALGRSRPPESIPHWQGTMVGWRHGRDFGANTLYVDSHVALLRPKRPTTVRELKKTVDTVRTMSWLPAEISIRMDSDKYNGEIEEWRLQDPPLYPAWNLFSVGGGNTKEIAGDQRVPQNYPEELSANHRTANKLWKKLPNEQSGRKN